MPSFGTFRSSSRSPRTLHSGTGWIRDSPQHASKSGTSPPAQDYHRPSIAGMSSRATRMPSSPWATSRTTPGSGGTSAPTRATARSSCGSPTPRPSRATSSRSPPPPSASSRPPTSIRPRTPATPRRTSGVRSVADWMPGSTTSLRERREEPGRQRATWSPVYAPWRKTCGARPSSKESWRSCVEAPARICKGPPTRRAARSRASSSTFSGRRRLSSSKDPGSVRTSRSTSRPAPTCNGENRRERQRGCGEPPGIRVWHRRRKPLEALFSGYGWAADVPPPPRRGEALGKAPQLRRGLVAGDGEPVAGGDHPGFQAGEPLDALSGSLPVEGKWGRRPAQLAPAGKVRAPRVEVHGREGVGGQKHAVGLAPQGDVAGGVTRRVQPAPAGEAQHTTGGQGVQPVAEVVAVVRHEPGHLGHGAPHRRVARRVVRPPREVRHLQVVGVERHVPLAGEVPRRAGVVEMPVREEDRLWPRTLPEPELDRPADVASRPLEAGVYEQPGSARFPEREHVDEHYPEARHPRGYGLEHNTLLVEE